MDFQKLIALGWNPSTGLFEQGGYETPHTPKESKPIKFKVQEESWTK